MYFLIISLDMMIMILISVAFLTLLERKILGYIQTRKGPNKLGMMGIIQPFSDAIKLFSKEFSLILKSNFMLYIYSPLFSMILMLILWNFLPLYSEMLSLKFSMIIILCFMSMGVYSMMMAGWSSNSIYSLIGSLRSIAQTISYEVSMILIILVSLILIESFNFYKLSYFQYNLWFLFLNLPMSLIFMVSLLAELNRTPFDFAEGESELVSGFNIEYMSGSFALIFISEYGMIIFMMFLYSLFYVNMFYNLLSFLINMFMLFMIIWIRGTFPRFRYDNLMYLTWLSYLPLVLNFLMIILTLKMYMFINYL